MLQWHDCICLRIIITSLDETECDGCEVQQAVFIIAYKFEGNLLMTILQDLIAHLTVVYLCPNVVIQLPSVDCKHNNYNHSCCFWDQVVETKFLDSDCRWNQTKGNWVYTSVCRNSVIVQQCHCQNNVKATYQNLIDSQTELLIRIQTCNSACRLKLVI